MMISIFVCIGALIWLLLLIRRDQISLGLPLAYLYLLLLNHLPGAYAHWISGGEFLRGFEETEIGIYFTAIGSVSFVLGVWFARMKIKKLPVHYNITVPREFSKFCLLGGWFFVYGLNSLIRIPSLGAAIEKGGAVWMLGVMLGMKAALQRRDVLSAVVWASALMVYPTLTLLLAGFLSYGTAAFIIVCAILAVSAVRISKVLVVTSVVTFLGVTLFTNYFAHRDEIREVVWTGAPMLQRLDAVLGIYQDFSWLDPTDYAQLLAMDARLNQNYFVGLAAERINLGEVDYLHGRSVWEGLLSLVPRAIWPDKPVFAGSPKVVSEMTGLELNPETSWGVGSVMEFQINFGVPGLVFGFLLLGWLLGLLDRKAAEAERSGESGRIFFYFLPAAALILPIGSLVELSGGAAAALVAAFAWNWAWERWSAKRLRRSTLERNTGLVRRHNPLF